MVEIPEHLLQRSREAMAAAKGASGDAPSGEGGAEPAAESPAAEAAEPETAPPAEASESTSKIPAHLLERSQAARAQASGEAPGEPPSGGSGGGTATAALPKAAAAPTAGKPAAKPAAAAPTTAPARTQRLLAVVKAGSIQTTKKDPVDKVNTWPHLLGREFVALLAVTVFLTGFSILLNAPLQEQANFNETPNPSKAPWYFLGLQELLTLFDPMVAGVMLPGIGVLGLIVVPYIDRNPATKPSERKFAITMFTMFMVYWAILSLFSIFFRGPGFNFVWPWTDGIFFEF